MTASSSKTLAVFDFDGTITHFDTLFPFLFYCAGFWRSIRGMLLSSYYVGGWLLGFQSRNTTKELVIDAFLKGCNSARYLHKGKQFSRLYIPKVVRKKAMKKIRWHKKKGHTLVVNTASLDAYILPWAKQQGFNTACCTVLQRGKAIRGGLYGKNCRGPEKVARLRQAFGDLKKYHIYAYGDSKGDKELLAVADKSYYKEL